jgi:hypothetical protein
MTFPVFKVQYSGIFGFHAHNPPWSHSIFDAYWDFMRSWQVGHRYPFKEPLRNLLLLEM